MKTLKYFIPVVVFFALLIIASCKKYPDGPLLSFMTKKSRIDGFWNVEYFSVNGYDSTAYLKSQPFYALYELHTQESDGKMQAIYNPKYNGDFLRTGFWEFQDKKNNLYIEFNHYTISDKPTIGPYGASGVSWEIRRLTEHDLWIRVVYRDGKEYFVKFKRLSI